MARLTDQDYDLLSAYLDNDLTDPERSALDARLQAEPELRAEVEALRATVDLIRSLPPLSAPRDYVLDKRLFRPARVWIFPATPAFSAISAAAATLLVVLGLMTLFSANRPQPAALEAPQMAALATVPITITASPTLAIPADAAAKASPTDEAELTALSDVQEESSTMQRNAAPDALAAPGAAPAPQGSPPPMLMQSAAAPTPTLPLSAGAAAVEQFMPTSSAADLFAAPAALELTATTTPTSTPTNTPTPSPTAVPASNTLGAALLIAGAALLALALVTTLLRRRR